MIADHELCEREIAGLRAEIERLSPPLAPVLEWWQSSWGDGQGRGWYSKGTRWRISVYPDGVCFLNPIDVMFSPKKYDDPFESAKSLASSIQRLLDDQAN